jgi:hypothetical protein
MKRAMASLLLFAAMVLTTPVRADKKPQPDFKQTLSKATLAVYSGKQVCAYKDMPVFFGMMPIWTCAYESRFTCTATVIAKDSNDFSEESEYTALTAGHCFSYGMLDKGYDYLVSDGVKANPVLRKIELVKFESNDQYDYAIFHFYSLKDYPVIKVAKGQAVPSLGSRVVNVNFSLGVTKEIVEGPVVSEQIADDESVKLPDIRKRYLVQIPFGPGASGSAVVNEDTHEIVGLVEAMFPGTQMAGVVIPTGNSYLNFLEDDSVGIKPQPEPPKAPESDPQLLVKIKALFRYFFPSK